MRTYFVRILSALMLFSAATKSAHAADNPLLTLKGLVTLCDRDDEVSRAACGAYITGFIAGSQATREADVVKVTGDRVVKGAIHPSDPAINAAALKLDQELKDFCIKSEWTANYVSAVVVQYGREHSSQLNERTNEHMLEILAKAFPCASNRPPN